MNWLLILLSAAAAPPQNSASPVQVGNHDAVLARLHECGLLKDDRERLKCYDHGVQELQAAVADGALVFTTHAQMEKQHRAAFGYSQPEPRFAKTRPATTITEIKEINSIVRSVRPTTYARYNLTLDDGSVWQNIDLLSTSPSPGDKVQISRTPFGSYLMKIPFSESVHAKRVR